MRVKRALIVTMFCTACLFVGHGQVVLLGKWPPYGNRDYCDQVEHIQPNLTLKTDTRVRGRITDQTTAPFKDSPVELRRFISETKQVPLKKVSTDAEGKFDLGVVRRGEYRLLLSPSRGFKQPAELECRPKECNLETMLVVNPTDELAAPCPIR